MTIAKLKRSAAARVAIVLAVSASWVERAWRSTARR